MSAVVSPFGTATDHGDAGTLRFLTSYTYWSIAQWDNDGFPGGRRRLRPSAPMRPRQRLAGWLTLVEASGARATYSPALVDWCLESLTSTSCSAPSAGVDLSMLTVVVPSLNRQDYVLRQVRYWSSSSAHLVIVDGSSSPLSDRIRSAIETHSRITYRHVVSSLPDRLGLAGGLIKTPYAVMLGDDEFHLQTGLSASVAALEENPDLVGCTGQVLRFTPVGRYRRIAFERAYPTMHGYSIRHPAPVDRLIAAMSGYNAATCYAVLRSPIWQKSWGSVGNWGAGAAIELQQAAAVYLLGGFATTNCVQWLRSDENPPGNASPDEKDLRVKFQEWWLDQPYEAERSAFVSLLVDSVSDELGADHDECAAWVVAGAEAYVASIYIDGNSWKNEWPPQGPVSRLRSVVATMLRAVVRRLPDPLTLRARRWRGQMLRLLGRWGGNYYGTVEDLPRICRSESLTIPPDAIAEIALIEVMVREFHALPVQGAPGEV